MNNIAIQAPAFLSGHIGCGAPAQSGGEYYLPEPGGALLVDERDVAGLAKLGFTAVPSARPMENLRVGLVYIDEVAGFMRHDGSVWAPVTL